MLNSVSDPYHIDTDLDSGCEKIRTDPDPGRTLIQIRFRKKFVTDPDPGKNDTDPDPGKRIKY